MAEKAVRWVSPQPTLQWPAVFLATRTGRRHTPRQSNPHSGYGCSLRYCELKLMRDDDAKDSKCLNVPPFVVAVSCRGHAGRPWARETPDLVLQTTQPPPTSGLAVARGSHSRLFLRLLRRAWCIGTGTRALGLVVDSSTTPSPSCSCSSALQCQCNH